MIVNISDSQTLAAMTVFLSSWYAWTSLDWLVCLILTIHLIPADNAYACDPRIAKFKEEEKARKQAQKQAKRDAARQRLEEEERVGV